MGEISLERAEEVIFDEKWKERPWLYIGDSFYAGIPNDKIQLLEEAAKHKGVLDEYLYETNKDYIVVFVYEEPYSGEVSCYFIINVSQQELTMVKGHNNTILSDEYHNRISDEYCQAVGLRRSRQTGWDKDKEALDVLWRAFQERDDDDLYITIIGEYMELLDADQRRELERRVKSLQGEKGEFYELYLEFMDGD